MVRVKHPDFALVVYEVPADDLAEWLAAGWLALDDTPRAVGRVKNSRR